MTLLTIKAKCSTWHRVHARISNILEVHRDIPFPHSEWLIIRCCYKPPIAIYKLYSVNGTKMPVVFLHYFIGSDIPLWTKTTWNCYNKTFKKWVLFPRMRNKFSFLNYDYTDPQSLVIARSHTESRASSETSKLCRESHTSVFILVTEVIATVISHSEFFITHRWIAIWPMFVAKYFPQFRMKWK